MSKTACIVPWSNLAITTDGCARFCCYVPGVVTLDGRAANIGQDSIDEIWNGDELVSTRAAMARGERPEGCSVCWDREDAGGVSRRLEMNDAYKLVGGGLELEALPQLGATTGFRLERMPDWFILELGNVCNLKCRSCGPLSSSAIAADQIHSDWEGMASRAAADSMGVTTQASAKTAGPSVWFKDIAAVADMVARGADGAALLSLMGGETFLTKQTWQLLEALIERGVAENIYVGLATNGQQRSAKLAELAPHFRGFNVTVSIDGYGPLNDYLRHGANWSKLLDNLDWFRQIPNVGVACVPTLQNGNAVDLVTLLRFLDEFELQLVYNVVTWPQRLRATNLPPSVRALAAERLRSYLETDCRPVNTTVVRGYCELLEDASVTFDEALFEEFMVFTNDLDASRGENLADASPELAALIAEAGIQWSNGRGHPNPVGGGDPDLIAIGAPVASQPGANVTP